MRPTVDDREERERPSERPDDAEHGAVEAQLSVRRREPPGEREGAAQPDVVAAAAPGLDDRDGLWRVAGRAAPGGRGALVEERWTS